MLAANTIAASTPMTPTAAPRDRGARRGGVRRPPAKRHANTRDDRRWRAALGHTTCEPARWSRASLRPAATGVRRSARRGTGRRTSAMSAADDDDRRVDVEAGVGLRAAGLADGHERRRGECETDAAENTDEHGDDTRRDELRPACSAADAEGREGRAALGRRLRRAGQRLEEDERSRGSRRRRRRRRGRWRWRSSWDRAAGRVDSGVNDGSMESSRSAVASANSSHGHPVGERDERGDAEAADLVRRVALAEGGREERDRDVGLAPGEIASVADDPDDLEVERRSVGFGERVVAVERVRSLLARGSPSGVRRRRRRPAGERCARSARPRAARRRRGRRPSATGERMYSYGTSPSREADIGKKASPPTSAGTADTMSPRSAASTSGRLAEPVEARGIARRRRTRRRG